MYAPRGGSLKLAQNLRIYILFLAVFLFAALFLLLCGCHKQKLGFLEEQQAPLSFLFFSDTQTAPESENYSALEELFMLAVNVEQQPVLAVFGGDTVNKGGDTAEWQNFWLAAETPLAGLITAAVAGNHDNHILLAEQFDYPRLAPLGQGEGFFYSFDLGPVHFIMLDSNIMGAANRKDVEWLQSDLNSVQARQAIWRIAVMHHPMWSVVENPKDIARAETMREHFLPLLEAGSVDLLLVGHQHVFTRSLPMRGDVASDDGNGIIQIMTASGMKESYILGSWEFIAVSATAPNYLLLIADSDELTVTAYDEQGKAFDICVFTR